MRTIIINALGRELRKNPIFFLPFEEEQLFWLERDFTCIESCIEDIATICNEQIKRQDYRLVVLADPVCFRDGQYPIARNVYEQLIRAVLNRKLLGPLLEHPTLTPRNVSLIFMISRLEDGNGNIIVEQILDRIFNISAESQPITELRISRFLPGGSEESLDVSYLFEGALQNHIHSIEQRKLHHEPLNNHLVFGSFRDKLNLALTELQNCSYVPAGSTQSKNLAIYQREFIPKTTDPLMIWTDLQMNLCDHLVKQTLHPNQDVEMLLPAHTQEELEARISRASSRVDHLLSSPNGQTYYPLVNQPRSANAKLKGKIWEVLSTKASQLPGVENAKKYSEHPDMPRPDTPSEELQRAWFLVDQEIRQFHQLCTRLDAEYNDELVTEQQQSILNLCAQAFREWRSENLGTPPALPADHNLRTQPELDDRKLRTELTNAQRECTRVTVEKLADYADVRQEAEVIKAGFRMAGRFWSPDCGSANSHNFRLFSMIMAALFLIQMLLPYMGIALGQATVSLDRYAHFILSAAVFAGIYCVGMLIWLRGLCEELHGYSKQMSQLIHKSSRRREDSIEAAVEAYSSVLPNCMNLRDNLRELHMIHATNQVRKTNYEAHMRTLREAKSMLQTLATQLQLPDSDYYTDTTRSAQALAYHLPPSHRSNMCFYTLFSDKWGGDSSC